MNLKSILTKEGLDVISYEDVLWRSEFQRGWNDNLLTVYEELEMHFPLAQDAPPDAPMTKEKFRGMFAAVTKECNDGVWLFQPAIALLAQKP